jgi:hypothetical protein
MFDFMRWRQFMRDRAQVFRSEGFTTELRLSDHSPKPGTALDVAGRKVIASFANWNTGETDYDIADTDGKMISSRWGILLDDDSFPTAFDEFAEDLRNAERS